MFTSKLGKWHENRYFKTSIPGVFSEELNYKHETTNLLIAIMFTYPAVQAIVVSSLDFFVNT
jgi:hypothetical protein